MRTDVLVHLVIIKQAVRESAVCHWKRLSQHEESKDRFDILVRAVGHSCVNPVDCGDFGDCLNQVCACKPGHPEIEASDFLSRPIKTCARGNILPLPFSPNRRNSLGSGVDQLRFNPLFFVFLARVFLA